MKLIKHFEEASLSVELIKSSCGVECTHPDLQQQRHQLGNQLQTFLITDSLLALKHRTINESINQSINQSIEKFV